MKYNQHPFSFLLFHLLTLFMVATYPA